MPRGTMRDCLGSGVKCTRRMANSTGSVRELGLWLWAGGGGETFGEGTGNAVEDGGLIEEGFVDGTERGSSAGTLSALSE